MRPLFLIEGSQHEKGLFAFHHHICSVVPALLAFERKSRRGCKTAEGFSIAKTSEEVLYGLSS
jgi:hypothetical protein